MNRIKVFTFFSESHRQLLDVFTKSFPYEDGVDLTVRFLPQECASANFESSGWNRTMERKIDYIIEYLQSMDDTDMMVHADVDINFYRPFKGDLQSLMADYDILFQNDVVCLCMGFFIAKKTDKLVELMKQVRGSIDRYGNDQYAMNALIKSAGLKYGILPDRYYTFGMNRIGVWNPGINDFSVPSDIVLHHANWTVGVENKINLMNLVSSKVN